MYVFESDWVTIYISCIDLNESLWRYIPLGVKSTLLRSQMVLTKIMGLLAPVCSKIMSADDGK